MNSGDATVIDCTFSNNTVVNGPQFGGAINHQGTRLVITGTTFIGNNAAAEGSALSCGNPSLAPATALPRAGVPTLHRRTGDLLVGLCAAFVALALMSSLARRATVSPAE